MERSDYNETRAVARLPHLDIEILHRRQWQGEEQQLLIMLRAVPPSELIGHFIGAANPLLIWSQLMRILWAAWLSGGRSGNAAGRRPELKTRGENC